MKPLIPIIFLSLILTNCGFKPIYNSKNSNFEIIEIENKNENKNSFFIEKTIMSLSNKNAKNKVKLEIDYAQSISTILKDSKGDPSKKKLSIDVIIKVKNDKNIILVNQRFNEEFSYDVQSDKFGMAQYEENIADNLNSKASEKISSGIANLIPGEGVTEVSVEITDETSDDPDFSILALRDLSSTDNSNFFTQFSLGNTMVSSEPRIAGNLGFGYRILNSENTFMFGLNSFYDYDFDAEHERASIGLELKGSILDLSANKYQKLSNMIVVDGREEQVLSGWDVNLASQIPHMPWAIFNVKGYSNEAEKAVNDSDGVKYSFEAALTPTVQFDISLDDSKIDGEEDVYSANLNFVYPPRENKKTLQDGLTSEDAFEKENMEGKLREKVRRNNKLIVEIQGAVIVTSK